MGLFNFIETIFFFSLAITFLLILLLVYHFKQRISSMEQKSDTMFDIINGVVKELSNIKKIVMIQSQLIRPTAVFPHNTHSANHNHSLPVLEEMEEKDEVENEAVDLKKQQYNTVSNEEDISDDEDTVEPYDNDKNEDIEDNSDIDDDIDEDIDEDIDDDITHKTIDLNRISKENKMNIHSIVSNAIPISISDLGEGHFMFGNSFSEILIANMNYNGKHMNDTIAIDDRVEELVDVDNLPDENIQGDIEEMEEPSYSSLENTRSNPLEELDIMDFEPIENNTLLEVNTLEVNDGISGRIDTETDITTTNVPETIHVNKLEETIEVTSVEALPNSSTEPVSSNRDMYEKMTVQQLKALAITRGIATNVKKMHKSDLIKLLLTEE